MLEVSGPFCTVAWIVLYCGPYNSPSGTPLTAKGGEKTQIKCHYYICMLCYSEHAALDEFKSPFDTLHRGNFRFAKYISKREDLGHLWLPRKRSQDLTCQIIALPSTVLPAAPAQPLPPFHFPPTWCFKRVKSLF